MAETEFALPKSSYGELLKMVHAYFLSDQRSRGEPVAVPDVAGVAGMNRSILSRNNKFFHALGIIEGGQKKKLTALGRELGLAVSHEDQALVRTTLARLVENSDFLARIVSAVRIRGGMDAAALQTHIAITAGARKSGETTTGTSALMQLLEASGHLVDDGGTLRVGAVETEHREPEREQESPRVAERVRPAETQVPLVSATRLRSASAWPSWSELAQSWPGAASSAPSITLNITLQIDTENVGAARDLIRELLGQRPGDEQAQAPGAEDE